MKTEMPDVNQSMAGPTKDTEKRTCFRWVVGVLIFVIYTIAGADRANLGFVLPFIRKEFHMSNAEAGSLASAYLISYAIFQLPTGFACARWGVRKIFTAGMVLTSMFTGLIGTSTSSFLIKIYRFGLGIGEAPVGVGIPATINQWFPPKEKGTMGGVYFAAIKFGPVIVPIIGAMIIQRFSWHAVFYFFAAPGLLLSAVWYWLVKNDPAESPYCSRKEVEYIKTGEAPAKRETAKPKAAVSMGWLDKLCRIRPVKPIETTKGMFFSWNVLGIAIGYFCIVGIVNVILTWIPTYLMQVKGYPIMTMGIVASMPWIGGVAGNLVGGWASDTIFAQRRKPTMLVMSLSTCFMAYAMIYAPNGAMLLSILLFALGFLLNVGYAGFMVYLMKLTTKEKYPIAYALINTFGQVGGACAAVLAGVVLDKFNWDVVFIFIAGYSALCFVVLLTIVEPMKHAEA
jgi:sugar phosphate permease